MSAKSQSYLPAPAEATDAFSARLAAYVHATRNAFSDNTERAIRADLALFRSWCAERRLAAIPARVDTVTAFIDAMAVLRAPATVRRYVFSIALAHRAVGCSDTLADPLVKLAMRRMHRTRGRRQKQAHGLTWPLRERLLVATTVRLTEWLRRAGVADGRLFRSLSKGGVVGNYLHPSQIPRIYKAMARTAGLPADVADAVSGHSARVGAAQDMIAAGIGLPAILQADRWKTPSMVSRYGERLLPSLSGAAQLARSQQRE